MCSCVCVCARACVTVQVGLHAHTRHADVHACTQTHLHEHTHAPALEVTIAGGWSGPRATCRSCHTAPTWREKPVLCKLSPTTPMTMTDHQPSLLYHSRLSHPRLHPYPHHSLQMHQVSQVAVIVLAVLGGRFVQQPPQICGQPGQPTTHDVMGSV